MSLPKKELKELKIERKTGDEKFTFKGQDINDVTITDFWKWYASDLINNALRGNLAEFIVGLDLGQRDNIQIGWSAWDLTYKGIKIEVKSSSYIQSWYQEDYSKITFGISKSRSWEPKTNKFSDDKARQADVYVFAVLYHKDQETVDPLNLDQWIFYIIDTPTIDSSLGEARTVGLSMLEKIGALRCDFSKIKEKIMEVVK